MSNASNARRSDVAVFFAGKEITKSLRPYLISLSYTDNEEEAADDLQIKIEDRDGVWLTKWLNQAIQSAASGSLAEDAEQRGGAIYKVKSYFGAAVRSRPGKQYYEYGTLAYGTLINSISVDKGWVKFDYNGKDGYVDTACLTLHSDNGNTTTFKTGDEVIVNGQPQFTSFGIGIPFQKVTNYKGKVTNFNKSTLANYPVKVGSLGWFTTAQVQKKDDKSGSGGMVDKVTKGLLIQATILRQNWNGDGKDRHLDCGQFELDSVDCSGPPSTISIKGTSLPYNRTLRQTKKSRSWEAYTLRGIAEEMASESGMTCMFSSAYNPKYRRVEQIATSDIAFLQGLCNRAGASLKITNNIIVIFNQEEYEGKDAVRVIERGDGTYSKYKLGSGEADTKYASCRVSYTDPKTGDVLEAIAYAEGYDESDEGNQQYEVVEKIESISEAQERAAMHLRLKNKYEYTASFTFPGDPTLLAGNTVELKGWGAWDGKYIIKQAKHTVSKSGYTTQISLRYSMEG